MSAEDWWNAGESYVYHQRRLGTYGSFRAEARRDYLAFTREVDFSVDGLRYAFNLQRISILAERFIRKLKSLLTKKAWRVRLVRANERRYVPHGPGYYEALREYNVTKRQRL